ncbi:MAG: VWA domain-containing protein [Planctomycetes bacterium]|nr:VWA domain-containing protein [Planctomycetota bacterium]
MSKRSYAQLRPLAKWSSLGLRAAILLCLIGALTQPAIIKQSYSHHVVFLLDVSQSITDDNLDSAMASINKLAGQTIEMGHTISVIAFGENASLEVKPQDEWEDWPESLRDRFTYQRSLPALYAQRTNLLASGESIDKSAMEKLQTSIKDVEEFRKLIAGDSTNIDIATRLALNSGSTQQRHTIYIYTDGNFNRGQWSRAWDIAKKTETTLHTVKLDRPIPPEVAISEVALPSTARTNQGFTARIRLVSNVETEAQLSIFKDGYVFSNRNTQVSKGETIIEVPGLYFLDKGFHTIEVVIQPVKDTHLQNNTFQSLIIVPGEARILYVDGNEDQMLYLKSALELEGISVDARPDTGVPQTMTELLSYDAFILCNVPADRLSQRQMQMIRSYVRDFGGGFIMLGGEESFGLGGYFKTPIEEILPVSMPIQKDLLRPSLGLILVIDKSGSMAGAKIQLAKRAAIATAEAINPRDRIGVIGFDSESRIILELTSAGNRAAIASHIANLEAGGGTFLYPALEDAYRQLIQSNVRRKHIIVLSDGQTQGFGYQEFVQQMAADGITLSAVGIGEGADMQLMEAIAIAGGGRAYFTNDFFSIPQIFTREALRASKNMLIERLVQPIALTHDALLDEIDVDELPLLTGYVATTAKQAADILLVSDSGDPILAKWRYGLGRSIAYTSEAKPRWAEDWLQWEDFAKFWAQLVRSVTGEDLAQTIAVERNHQRTNTNLLLQADVSDSSGEFLTDINLLLTSVDAQGRSNTLDVKRIGPGQFQAQLPSIKYGQAQQFVWHAADDLEEIHTFPYGFIYSFSPEHSTLGANETVFADIQATGAGQVMSLDNSKLIIPEVTSQIVIALWPYLLTIALLLVPIDILCRRLG